METKINRILKEGTQSAIGRVPFLYIKYSLLSYY